MFTTIASILKMKKTATTQSNIVPKPISLFWELVSKERSRLALRTCAIDNQKENVITEFGVGRDFDLSSVFHENFNDISRSNDLRLTDYDERYNRQFKIENI
jgi:hypothetical protein